MQLSPIDRLFANIPVTSTLADGTTAVLSGVDVAVLAHGATPSANTAWTRATSYINGVATVLLAGPAADPTNAIPVSDTGGDLWIRITDSPEVEAVYVSRIYVR